MDKNETRAEKRIRKPIIITKVELGKHGIIKIDYDKSRDGMYESFRMESADKAAPEFYDAFQYLASHIQAIMSLDTVVLGRIIPKKIMVSYDELGRMTVKLGFNLLVPMCNDSVQIITPPLKETDRPVSELSTERPAELTVQTLEAIHFLLDETTKYLNGERAQGNLFKQEAV